jgi:hypothetical protein
VENNYSTAELDGHDQDTPDAGNSAWKKSGYTFEPMGQYQEERNEENNESEDAFELAN